MSKSEFESMKAFNPPESSASGSRNSSPVGSVRGGIAEPAPVAVRPRRRSIGSYPEPDVSALDKLLDKDSKSEKLKVKKEEGAEEVPVEEEGVSVEEEKKEEVKDPEKELQALISDIKSGTTSGKD